MGVIVSFNYANWVALFPQFTYIGPDQAQQWFNLATTYCRNDGGGPVTDPNMQTTLLNLLTAHIAQLFAPNPNDQSSSNLVGRISNASEGSVSVATENNYPPGSAQWYQQTKFGSAYWEASKPFRTMRYLPGPPRPTEPFPVAGNVWATWTGFWGR